ncbi:MAG TPA: hypothetical protein VGQ67_05440 [Candidatus Polarisedimenticolia bacterium]|nr:hypothetical protein [Candidatus Polarisedimenticolia bacterium]
MSRPYGVTLAALGVVVSSAWLVSPVTRGAGAHHGRPILIAAAVLAALALLTAEAMWNRRPHAFALFSLWSLAGMVMLVLFRFATHGSSHLAAFVPSLVTAGIAFAAAALYLRRAL